MLFPIVGGKRAKFYLKLSHKAAPQSLIETDNDEGGRYYSLKV